MSNMTPREIVHELDKHIVGQEAAKRAVSIALRNRWRRMQLAEELRGEITPKNILMIGPTGVGKTEISRRLAKLAGAPFIKVEATKFTEVGYVGRDVEQIIRDLVDRLLAGDKAPDQRDLVDSLLHSIACKAAIKAGDRLSTEEVSALLEQRHLAQDAHHCPHGRPTALVFTRDELDRQFKRT